MRNLADTTGQTGAKNGVGPTLSSDVQDGAKGKMVPEEDKQVKSKYLIYLSYIHFED
jgi:hypothetical protein